MTKMPGRRPDRAGVADAAQEGRHTIDLDAGQRRDRAGAAVDDAAPEFGAAGRDNALLTRRNRAAIGDAAAGGAGAELGDAGDEDATAASDGSAVADAAGEYQLAGDHNPRVARARRDRAAIGDAAEECRNREVDARLRRDNCL